MKTGKAAAVLKW